MDETLKEQMMVLAQQGFRCSQIMLALALGSKGKKDPDLVRAMGGLIVGIGFTGKTCGALTGGACLISFFAGKGTPEEKEHPRLWPMVEEFVDWFEQEVGKNQGFVDCDRILEHAGADKPSAEVCGPIVMKAYSRALSILRQNDAL